MAFSFIRPTRYVKIGPNALAAEGTASGFLTVDATVSEEHAAQWALTSHPVPEGINVTDHKRRSPRVIKMSCVISNTPLSQGISELGDLTNVDEAVSSFRQNASALQASGTLARSERDTNAWEQLKAYADSAELLDVYTTLESYTNMQISEISTVRTAQTGNALHFDITLQEIRIADEKTAEALQLRTGRPKETKQSRKGKRAKPLANNKAKLQAARKAGGLT
jgi:hypothetical protein